MLTAGAAGRGSGVTLIADNAAHRDTRRGDRHVAGARRAARRPRRRRGGAAGLGARGPVPAAVVADQRRQQDPLADPVPAAADHRADRLPRGGAGAGEAGARPLAGGAQTAARRARGAGAVPPPLAVPARRTPRGGRRALRGAGAGPDGAAASGPAVELATCARPSATRSRSTASRSACRPAPSTASSGPTGPARRRRLRILAGLAHADAGAVRILGRDVAGGGADARSLIGFLPDVPAFYKWMTAPEYLRFAGSLFGLSGRRAGRPRRPPCSSSPG